MAIFTTSRLAGALLLASAKAAHGREKEEFVVPFKVDALNFAYAREKDPRNYEEPWCNEIYDDPDPVDALVIRNEDSWCPANCAIGQTARGEWVEYLFKSTRDDYIDIAVQISSKSRKNKVLLKVDGNSVGVLQGPGLGLDNYRKRQTNKPVFIRSGVTHKFLVKFLSSDINLCYIDVLWSNRVFDVPFIAEALDFFWAKDMTSRKEYMENCGTGTVDAVYTPTYYDTCSAKCHIMSTKAGEWVEYKFRSDMTQRVDISPRIASTQDGRPFRRYIKVKLDGKTLGTLQVPVWESRGNDDFQKRTLSNVTIEGGKTHKLEVKFATSGIELCSVSVVPARSDQLTQIAKYEWLKGAKDSSRSSTKHDGVIATDRGVVAENGELKLPHSRSSAVNFGFMEELDGADAVLFRFEDVKIDPYDSGYSILAGTGEELWWVGLGTLFSSLVFHLGGWGDPSFSHWVQADAPGSHIESIEYRFNGTEPPEKRLAIRYNGGSWVEGGWTDPNWSRKFLSNRDVKIRANADMDNYGGTIGPVSIWANT